VAKNQIQFISYFDHSTARWFFICDLKGLKHVTVNPLSGAVQAASQQAFVQAHARALANMLDGHSAPYPLPLNIAGSPFQMKVWQEIAAIPHGKTIHYTELAARVGNTKAVRATGSACGANPVPLAIPCHRVLRADGSLGGFAFGLQLKQRMLDFEIATKKMAA
jgi:O-6-methylguanine DNA methyltransferase